MNYDIIGDIHGHYHELTLLLEKMDYEETESGWAHPDRKALFLGDFIDRGPEQLKTVLLVKKMVEHGHALAVLGNHELNAMAWFTPDKSTQGEYLRPHSSEKNWRQHKQFLSEVGFNIDDPYDVAYNKALHTEIIDWFFTLPLWIDEPALRVIHACWHTQSIEYLHQTIPEMPYLPKEFLSAAVMKPDDVPNKDKLKLSVYSAVEAILKGIEIPLPDDHSFRDNDGILRYNVRVRWWDRTATTYKSLALLDPEAKEALPDIPVPAKALIEVPDGKPTFFGHYWLKGTPQLQAKDILCLDYSVARDGALAAYRFDGETELDPEKMVLVEAGSRKNPGLSAKVHP